MIGQATRCKKVFDLASTLPGDDCFRLANHFWSVDGLPNDSQFRRSLLAFLHGKERGFIECSSDELSSSNLSEGIFSVPPTGDIPKDGLDNDSDIGNYFYTLKKPFSNFLTSSFLHLGFDERALALDQFELWLHAQPVLNNRRIEITRLFNPDHTGNDPGLVDIFSGNSDKNNLEYQFVKIKAEPMNITFFRLPPLVEGGDQMINPITFNNMLDEKMEYGIEGLSSPNGRSQTGRRGVVVVDSTPGRTECKDIEDIFQTLTGKVFSEMYTFSAEDEALNDQQYGDYVKFLLMMSTLDKLITINCNLSSQNGWFKLYHVLLGACGFPKIDKNNNDHAFLTPRSFDELNIRVTLMFQSLCNIRNGLHNGQGRTCGYRYAACCVLPDENPVSKFVAAPLGRANYFDKFRSSNNILSSRLLKFISDQIDCELALPVLNDQEMWHQGVVEIIFRKSELMQQSKDQATTRHISDILATASDKLLLHPKIFCVMAEKVEKDRDGNNIGTFPCQIPPSVHFHRLAWLSYRVLSDLKNYGELKSDFGSDLAAYIKSRIQDKKFNAEVRLAIDEQSLPKAVDTLRKAKATFKNTDDLSDLMFSINASLTVLDGNEEQRVASNSELCCCFLFEYGRRNAPFGTDLIPTNISNTMSIPSAILFFAVLVTHIVYDERTAKVFSDFVKNNGYRAVSKHYIDREFLVGGVEESRYTKKVSSLPIY